MCLSAHSYKQPSHQTHPLRQLLSYTGNICLPLFHILIQQYNKLFPYHTARPHQSNLHPSDMSLHYPLMHLPRQIQISCYTQACHKRPVQIHPQEIS